MEGWNRILKEPEFKKDGMIDKLIKFIEGFKRYILNLRMDPEIKIFIGGENPFSKIQEFSVILMKCNLKNQDEGIVSCVGPKRMSYNEIMDKIKIVKNILEK